MEPRRRRPDLVEHDPLGHGVDVIDHVVDLGPEGGDGGGRVMAAGTPEEVAVVTGSATGQCLSRLLAATERLSK